MTDLEALLELLFKQDERCCPSDSKFGYHSVPVKELLGGETVLVSPNEKVQIRKVKTDELTLLAINPMNFGYRNDDNVSSFRTFLWEIDVGSLKSQIDYVKKLELPYSSAIFSGNKSIHFLTVLDQDIKEETYKLLYKWGLSIGTLFDQNCKNPSRSVRIPGAIRPDTGGKQRLIEIKNKVKLEDFMQWLSKYKHLEPKPYQKRKPLTTGYGYGSLSRWAKKQFEKGIDFSKGRNQTWFNLACDLEKSGFAIEEAEEILGKYFVEENDFKEKEFLLAIKSAFSKSRN